MLSIVVFVTDSAASVLTLSAAEAAERESLQRQRLVSLHSLLKDARVIDAANEGNFQFEAVMLSFRHGHDAAGTSGAVSSMDAGKASEIQTILHR